MYQCYNANACKIQKWRPLKIYQQVNEAIIIGLDTFPNMDYVNNVWSGPQRVQQSGYFMALLLDHIWHLMQCCNKQWGV